VRGAVAAALGIAATFTDPDQIVARYQELLAEKAKREAVMAKKTTGRALNGGRP
jgi:hypothetical protein